MGRDPLPGQLPPEITKELVYPPVDASKLTCFDEPTIQGDVRYDTDIPYQNLRDAWKDCSTKLGYVRDLVATWPKRNVDIPE